MKASFPSESQITTAGFTQKQNALEKKTKQNAQILSTGKIEKYIKRLEKCGQTEFYTTFCVDYI